MCNTYVSRLYIQPSTSGVLFFLSNCCQYLYFCTSQESTLVLVRGISHIPDWALWLLTFYFFTFSSPQALGLRCCSADMRCFTESLLLLYCCFTAALLLRYFCLTTAWHALRYVWFTCSLLLFYYCFTCALLVLLLYCCFTAALLPLYCRFTAALSQALFLFYQNLAALILWIPSNLGWLRRFAIEPYSFWYFFFFWQLPACLLLYCCFISLLLLYCCVSYCCLLWIAKQPLSNYCLALRLSLTLLTLFGKCELYCVCVCVWERESARARLCACMHSFLCGKIAQIYWGHIHNY